MVLVILSKGLYSRAAITTAANRQAGSSVVSHSVGFISSSDITSNRFDYIDRTYCTFKCVLALCFVGAVVVVVGHHALQIGDAVR